LLSTFSSDVVPYSGTECSFSLLSFTSVPPDSILDIELELPKSIRIHPVVNISRVRLYKLQVEGQKKIPPKLVIIEREEEFEVEKILNKRIVQGKEKFLVWWKGYTAEEDTWENRENLGNAKELVEEFEREYREEAKELR